MKNKNKSKKAAKAVKASRVVKNEYVRPGDGTKTGKVWNIADSLKSKLGRCPTRGEVLAVAKTGKLNLQMASTQYGRWRGFNGIEGRVSLPKVAKPAKAKSVKKAVRKLPAKPTVAKLPAPPIKLPAPPTTATAQA